MKLSTLIRLLNGAHALGEARGMGIAGSADCAAKVGMKHAMEAHRVQRRSEDIGHILGDFARQCGDDPSVVE